MADLIYFSQTEFTDSDGLQERFGLRGRNIMQLAQLKAPIAPGFLIDSDSIQAGLKAGLKIDDLKKIIEKMEKETGKTYSRPENPLLFKAVISPSIQIGTVRSVHTIGINDEVAEGLAKYCGEDFAFHEYNLFMESMGSRFLGKKASDFKAVKDANPKISEKELTKLYREKVVPDFPQDGFEQLHLVLSSLGENYKEDPMNEGIEAGIMTQMMVYGNYGENSYSGSVYSRNIVTGESDLSGYFGHNKFDTYVDNSTDIKKIDKKHLDQLQATSTQLEENFLDIRQIKFVIEEGQFWLIDQTPVEAKSTQAEIRTLLDLHKKGLIDDKKIVKSVPPSQLQDLLHPIIDHSSTGAMPKVVGGLAGSPGAAVGRVAFSTKALLAEYRRCSLMGVNSDLILIMAHTDAEDVEGIEMGVAVIASEGGYASHAPVVARSLRTPCLLFEDIEFKDGHAFMGGNKINEFDYISIEVPTYTDPTVWLGSAKLVYPDTSENGLEEFIHTLDKIPMNIKVLGNASSLEDIKVAIRLGAGGIGEFSMDTLIKAPNTLEAFREALLMSEPDLRKKALGEVRKHLEKDVLEVYKLVDGRKITMKMLNSPLTEFLPHSPEEQKEVYSKFSEKHKGTTVENFKDRASQLRNINPIMGQRGSRVAISHPDLYEVQSQAIFAAALKYSNGGKNPLDLDVLVPAIMGDAEMRFIRHGRNIESRTIPGIHTVEKEMVAESDTEKLPFRYRVGAVIEVPAAALMAGHISKQSDFFILDINMLTQTTNGMSTDDINMFLPSYTQYDILKDNPFQVLSMPVKELISATVHFGKMTRPDLGIGISGDHASDPVNVEFAMRSKLDFITCSPFGVPIAKLAVAQHMLK